MYKFFQRKKEAALPSWLPENTVIISKRKSLALEISLEKGIILRLPKTISMGRASEFLQQKKDWILKKWHLIQRRRNEQQNIRDRIFFFGEEYPKSFSSLKSRQKVFFDGEVFSFLTTERHIELLVNWYKKEARAFFSKEVPLWAEKMGVSFSCVRISSAQKRWGSCSSSGKISLTWRLMMLPKEVINYVIVHELAHREEMNHSKNFWKIVSTFSPEYKRHRIWLRENGHFFVL